jgi:hypothetical protein
MSALRIPRGQPRNCTCLDVAENWAYSFTHQFHLTTLKSHSAGNAQFISDTQELALLISLLVPRKMDLSRSKPAKIALNVPSMGPVSSVMLLYFVEGRAYPDGDGAASSLSCSRARSRIDQNYPSILYLEVRRCPKIQVSTRTPQHKARRQRFLTSARKGRPRVAITADALFRLGSLQCSQAEAARYFDCTERTIRSGLTTPKYRETWKMGNARGREHDRGGGKSVKQEHRRVLTP